MGNDGELDGILGVDGDDACRSGLEDGDDVEGGIDGDDVCRAGSEGGDDVEGGIDEGGIGGGMLD